MITAMEAMEISTKIERPEMEKQEKKRQEAIKKEMETAILNIDIAIKRAAENRERSIAYLFPDGTIYEEEVFKRLSPYYHSLGFSARPIVEEEDNGMRLYTVRTLIVSW